MNFPVNPCFSVKTRDIFCPRITEYIFKLGLISTIYYTFMNLQHFPIVQRLTETEYGFH